MSKIDLINSILSDKFLDNKGLLTEIDNDKYGKRFTMQRRIVSAPDINYSLYKFDSSKDIFLFFKDQGVDGLKKMCDYVFFIEESEHLFVYLVELKKGTESAKKQLDAGECFVQYILSTIDRLKLGLDLTEDNLHFRKIRISESKSRKKTLNMKVVEKSNGVIEHSHPQLFFLKEYLIY